MGRATQGVRLINLEKRNDQIGSVCKVTSEEEEIDVYKRQSMGIPFSSNARIMPIWVRPLAPPPLSTSPTFCAWMGGSSKKRRKRYPHRLYCRHIHGSHCQMCIRDRYKIRL